MLSILKRRNLKPRTKMKFKRILGRLRHSIRRRRRNHGYYNDEDNCQLQNIFENEHLQDGLIFPKEEKQKVPPKPKPIITDDNDKKGLQIVQLKEQPHHCYYRHCSENYRLFIRDRYSNESFLINGGSDISLFPNEIQFWNHYRSKELKKWQKQCKKQYGVQINGANMVFGESLIGTGDDCKKQEQMKITGKFFIALDFGFGHEFVFEFYLCETEYPVIGADFLAHYHLLPDYLCQQLIDFDYHRKVDCQIFPTVVDRRNVRSLVNIRQPPSEI